MRIHDRDNDRTVTDAAIYLTTREAAELMARLHKFISDYDVKHFSIADAEFDHDLHFYKYNEYELYGFDARQKQIITSDQ